MTEFFCPYCEQYHGIYAACVKDDPPEREYEPEEDDRKLDDRDFSKNRFDLQSTNKGASNVSGRSTGK